MAKSGVIATLRYFFATESNHARDVGAFTFEVGQKKQFATLK